MDHQRPAVESRSLRRLWQRQEVWYLLAAMLSGTSIALAGTGMSTGFALLVLLLASLSFGLGLLLQSAPEDAM